MKTPRFPIVVKQSGSRREERARGTTLEDNKEAVLAEMLMIASARITEILQWDAAGRVRINPSADVPDAVLAAVRSVKAKTKVYEDHVEHEIEFEMHDKAGMLRALAKGAGLLEPAKGGKRPGVIGIGAKFAPAEPPVPASPAAEKVGRGEG